MQRFFTALSPAFLSRLDHQLLINRPFIWATRIHHVLFWGLLGNLFALIYALLLPMSEDDLTSPWSGTLVLIFPVLIGLVLWGRSLQQTGYWDHLVGTKSKDLLRNQFLFGLGALVLSAMPIVFFAVVEYRSIPALLHYGLEHTESGDVALRWLLMIVPFIWMCVELFAYLRWIHILWTVVIGLGLVILETAVGGLLLMGSNVNNSVVGLLALLLIQLFAFLVAAYNREILSPAGRAWQTMCLVFASIILMLCPMVLAGCFAIGSEGTNFWSPTMISWLIVGGLALAGSLWHLGFRRRIMELQAQPDK
ncbi:MAG: hypothetical protein AB8H47_15690 [Bacteroidia bacterium]